MLCQTCKYNLILLLIKKSEMGTCVLDSSNHDLDQYHRSMFFFVAAIGKGGFGHVWKVKLKKTMEVFALKQMSKARILSLRSLNLVLNEKNLLQKISHKFIINMISAFQDRQNLYLLMEHLGGGDLRYYINNGHKFNQNQVKFIIRCILEALKYLHSENIIHRDIKPENIVFEETGYCKIADFGVAKEFRLENGKDTSGTIGYMAPQVICGQNYSYTADYFALGVVCYEIMMGKMPYQGCAKLTIKEQILAKQVQIPDTCKQFSTDMINFTNRLLQRNPKNRLGFKGIQEIITHPWLKIQDDQHIEFLQKRMKPPFVPPKKQKNYTKILGEFEQTEQDRQNALLLKQKLMQQLFKDYDYDMQRERKRSLNETKEVSMVEDQGTIQQRLVKSVG